MGKICQAGFYCVVRIGLTEPVHHYADWLPMSLASALRGLPLLVLPLAMATALLYWQRDPSLLYWQRDPRTATITVHCAVWLLCSAVARTRHGCASPIALHLWCLL